MVRVREAFPEQGKLFVSVAVAVTLSATFLGEALSSEAWYGFTIIGVGLLITDGRTFDKMKASVKRRL